ncbi:MAG TPA: PadR family transcriptional regulator, partial [Streptosporangiaceae bacterium]|nr:PadR family transcriptional regulator [Streptosporangiaceae bacterium]
MPGPQLTSFEHVLLGLICLSPASGYDLKRMFATTPMGLYQPSSGALYPALRRLEARGLIQVTDPPAANGSPRRRRVYEPAPDGRETHLTWLRTPVDPDTAPRDLGLHLMRFVMMEPAIPRTEVLAFLADLEHALAALTADLERYAAGPAPGGLHPGLALDHGLAVHRASLDWVRRAR